MKSIDWPVDGALLQCVVEPKVSAKLGGLSYVTNTDPGYSRERRGSGFVFRDCAGHLIKNPRVLKRIQSLGIPPAWRNVWICPQENGHLQAVGVDSRGRKQYRYHSRWREIRDETKYHRMLAFSKALPKIRSHVTRILARPGLDRSVVLAAVVRLLELSLIRVGNEAYRKSNQSFGLTTLRDHHVEIRGHRVHFQFRGKSGKDHEVRLEDRRLARIIKNCQDIPGQVLFQYWEEDGERNRVTSEDVNAFLKEISGGDFTAKDFRTWAGTMLMLDILMEYKPGSRGRQIKRELKEAILQVSRRLGNTPTICRKCYIHPAVLEAYENGFFWQVVRQRPSVRSSLDAREQILVGLLKASQRKARLQNDLTRSLSRSLQRFKKTKLRGGRYGAQRISRQTRLSKNIRT